MRIPPFSFLILPILFYCMCLPGHVSMVFGLCLEDQQSLLLQLKNTLKFNSSLSSKLVFWHQRLPCCNWTGVTCDKEGHVTGLDLGGESIYGGLDNSSALFSLQHLQILDLSINNFNTMIPPAISNLVHLSKLDLSYCNFSGTFPNSLLNLTKLNYLDLSYNNFFGPIPSSLDMLKSLTILQLTSNTFSGSIPSSLFALRLLEVIELSFNHFDGQINLDVIQSLQNLKALGLSDNNLSIDANTRDANLSSFPSLSYLRLASCHLKEFPMFLRNYSFLYYLDLSNNQIEGLIPHWIWELEELSNVNLSKNSLIGFEGSLQNLTAKFHFLDLHSNQLQGPIPKFPNSVYLDYSSNKFSSIIPYNVGSQLSFTTFLFLSQNNFHGNIPYSLCNASNLRVLDLSNNNLEGTIPTCLTQSEDLQILNLQNNMLKGNIPDTFNESCNMEIFNIHGNQLNGSIPKSLGNCHSLEFLDLGNNQISGHFPCLLVRMYALRVIVLRRNKFQGPLACLDTNGTWPSLQIFDLAFNNFSGVLPAKAFKNWEAMMHVEHQDVLESIEFSLWNENHYQVTMIVMSKGLEMKLIKILSIFNSIDFSSNNLKGPIPRELMNLKELHVLNLSHNALSGQISSSIENLKQLESLDISSNSLTGVIPTELASLSFLSFLNLSFNHLVGRIPLGTQLQSFDKSSFQGNDGLYGPPLTQNEDDGNQGLFPSPASNNHHIIDLNFLSVELGVVFGLGNIVGTILFTKQWRIRYWKFVDTVLCSIFSQLHLEYQTREGQTYTVLRWRH